MDLSRWRYLHDLINDRIVQAKGNVAIDLLEGLQALAQQADLDPELRRGRLGELQEKAYSYFRAGEMDASQHAMLREVIQESLRSLTT